MIELVPATPRHAEEIVKNLREHDKFEFDIARVDPVADMKKTLQKSKYSWAAIVDGEVGCMWGIKEETIATGAHIWLVTTSLIEKHPRRFLVESRKVVRAAVQSYYILYGYVDATYTISTKWMEWLGFVPVALVDIGQMKLIRYEMRAA